MAHDNNWGGSRPGAGRPRGSMSDEKRELLEKERAMRKRVSAMTDKLLNAQLALALGEVNLYRKTVRGNKTITTMIDDPEVIKEYLSGEREDDDNEYYYLATKSPDGKALDSLLDRTYGKARQSVDVTSGDEPIQERRPISQELLSGFADYMLEATKQGNPFDDEED